MSGRPRVLVLVPWYEPGYKAGGLGRAVANMVAALSGEIDFSIVTSDRDLGDAEPYPELPVDRWLERSGYRIMYLSPSPASYLRLARLLRREPWDTIHINGIFSTLFTSWPLMVLRGNSRRVILQSHGMLGEGALRIKARKKQLFLRSTGALRLYRGVTWHASTDLEAGEIRAVFPGARIAIAANVPDRPTVGPPGERAKTAGQARFCFFSRISPKKGLLEAIRFLARSNAGPGVVFDILGPIEDQAYWDTCSRELDPLRDRIEVTHRGAIDPRDVHTTLSAYHFMLLPTHNENFGYVILEALVAGCPVILSDQTPWRDLEARHAGWTIPLANPDRFARTIDACISMDAATFARHSRAAHDYALAASSDPTIAAPLRSLLLAR